MHDKVACCCTDHDDRDTEPRSAVDEFTQHLQRHANVAIA